LTKGDKSSQIISTPKGDNHYTYKPTDKPTYIGEIILTLTKGDKSIERISMLKGDNHYTYKPADKLI